MGQTSEQTSCSNLDFMAPIALLACPTLTHFVTANLLQDGLIHSFSTFVNGLTEQLFQQKFPKINIMFHCCLD